MINIYTFDVFIISGPMSEKFVEDNQVILRKIVLICRSLVNRANDRAAEQEVQDEQEWDGSGVGGRAVQDDK